MNHDSERLLEQLVPCPAPPELRQRVLAAVTRELAAGRPLRWERWCGLAVAAGLLLGLGLNAWVVQAQEQRLARLYGPRPVPQQIVELARAVESVTDAETAQRVQQQLATAQQQRQHRSQPGYRIEEIINALEKS